MKLSDIESRKLLPRFASKIAWLMDALDSIIKPISERVKSIDAPLTLEAIAALTDEELEALYDQYGVAQYYPELSRSTRDLMLYEMCKIYRYLGTPHAIELLCNYIFDNVPLNVHVIDNLAFDEHGTLIDATLLDVFDIEVNPDLPVLSVDATARLLANIIRFSRNSQALRDVIYTFAEDFDLSVCPLNAGIPAQNWDNDAICEPVTPPTPAYTEITLYMASGKKQAQKLITSTESTTMTTTANSSNMFSLYYDENLTQPFRYDYSNDYELGYYNSGGEWKTYLQSVYDMPATYTSDDTQWKLGYILYDTGQLWVVSNVSGSGYMAISATSIKVRIYPKEQQYYAGYFKSSNVYSNQSWSGTGSLTCRSAPNTSSYFLTPSGFPNVTIKKILTSSTMERNVSDFKKSGTTTLDIYHKVSGSVDSRLAVFTFDKSTYYSWLSLSGNVTCASGAIMPLLDANGNYVEIEPNAHYTAIGLIVYAGTFITTIGYLNNSEMGALDTSNPTRLCWKQTYGSVSISCVWYTKDYYIDVNFGDPVTIPAGYTVESVTCVSLYVKADTVSLDGTTSVNLAFDGEFAYCDDTDISLFGVRVDPCLQLFAITSDTSHIGYYLSCRSSFTGSNRASAASASVLNGGGKFLVGTATAAAADMSYIDLALRRRPVWISRTDSSGNQIPYYFKIQQSVWQFSGGVFSWLGDTSDATDPAHWYNGLAVRIHLRKI